MPLWPDLIIKERKRSKILLAVAVRAHASEPDEAAFKTYLDADRCASGMLVTPDVTRFYRNWYINEAGDSVERVGECSTRELLGSLSPTRHPEAELIERVDTWLESLRAANMERWPESVRDAIAETALPAILDGEVQGTGFRKTG